MAIFTTTVMGITITDMEETFSQTSLLRLLQLSSANLPVGAYSFSHGLEAAIDCAWVDSAETLENWLMDQMRFSLAGLELPVLLRFYAALDRENNEALGYWNAYVLACRETAELRLSDTAMAEALQRLLKSLDMNVVAFKENSYLTLYAQIARQWQVPALSAAAAYAWTWLENQVIAATKLMALGQTRAQQILSHLQRDIPQWVDRAEEVEDKDIGFSLPALAIASSRHETQYSRLFRS